MMNKIKCLVNFFSERNQSEESRHSEEEEDEDEDDQVSEHNWLWWRMLTMRAQKMLTMVNLTIKC